MAKTFVLLFPMVATKNFMNISQNLNAWNLTCLEASESEPGWASIKKHENNWHKKCQHTSKHFHFSNAFSVWIFFDFSWFTKCKPCCIIINFCNFVDDAWTFCMYCTELASRICWTLIMERKFNFEIHLNQQNLECLFLSNFDTSFWNFWKRWQLGSVFQKSCYGDYPCMWRTLVSSHWAKNALP